MRYFTLVVLVTLLAHVGASAHPHVFIETSITVSYDKNTIDKLLVCYNFDQMFSADLKQNFDKNQSNQFEPDEIEDIRKNAFANLVNYNYFVHVVDGGHKLKIESVNNFNATIGADGIVQYSFSVDTEINTATPNKVVKIAAFDHSYYIDVRLNEANIKFKNKELASYSWKVIEDKSMAYYYEQIYPSSLVLSFK